MKRVEQSVGELADGEAQAEELPLRTQAECPADFTLFSGGYWAHAKPRQHGGGKFSVTESMPDSGMIAKGGYDATEITTRGWRCGVHQGGDMLVCYARCCKYIYH
jgi:hypothetical protein